MTVTGKGVGALHEMGVIDTGCRPVNDPELGPWGVPVPAIVRE